MRLIATFLCAAALILTISGEAKAGTNVKFFPPDNCGSGAFVWDGTSDVRCAVLPICQAGQGLVYNPQLPCSNTQGICGGFECTWPLVGPPPCQTSAKINQGTCPTGEVGSIYDLVTTYCDGTKDVDHTDTCGVQIHAVSSIKCTPGDVLVGKFVSGVFDYCSGAGCTSWLCTTSGLVPD